MKQESAEQLREALSMEGYEASIDCDYSGRYMHGKTTYSVRSDAAPSEAMYIAGRENISKPITDNMGKDFIYY